MLLKVDPVTKTAERLAGVPLKKFGMKERDLHAILFGSLDRLVGDNRLLARDLDAPSNWGDPFFAGLRPYRYWIAPVRGLKPADDDQLGPSRRGHVDALCRPQR